MKIEIVDQGKKGQIDLSKKRKIKKGILLLFILSALFACDSQRVFEDYYSCSSTGWNKDSLAVFSFEIEDSTLSYNLLLSSRNLESYPYSNLWLFVEVLSPNSITISDTIEYKLAEANGKWTGKGTGGVYLNQFGYRSNVFFPQKGTYTVTVQHAMRNNDLKGLKDIGLRIEKR